MIDSGQLKPPAFVDCYGDLADRLTPEMIAISPGVEVFYDAPDNDDELIERLQGRRNVLVYMAFLSERVLCACPDLKTVAYLSTGLETHGDLQAAQTLGIRIEGVKGYGDRAVAEHTMALVLNALKRVGEGDRALRDGTWHLIRSEEVHGKTFGLLGLGGIGRETARLAAAMGAHVIAWSRSGDDGGTGTEMVSREQVLAQSDILSLHLALTPQTRCFLDASGFAQMKAGAILVNTARAGLVDEAAMMSALHSGKLRHCALDVFHDEPIVPGSPILSNKNVTLTPHSAWFTTQSIDRLLVAGLQLLSRHIKKTR